jgi:ankyrin repeat protein
MKKLFVLLAFCFLGSNVFAQTINDLTQAAWSGNTSEVEKILASGKVDVDGRDYIGRTALTEAARRGHLETTVKLIELGADVNARNCPWDATPIIFAAWMGHTEIVVKLVELGADINAKDAEEQTALMCAILNGHTETAAKLRELGAVLEVELQNNPKITKDNAENTKAIVKKLDAEIKDMNDALEARYNPKSTGIISAGVSKSLSAIVDRNKR